MKKYLVGGAVRDQLLGKTPKDRDWVLVGATQQDVQDLIAQGYEQVGADFPVFLHPETSEEYALARIERKSGVGYHGFTVQADDSVTIEEDLARRDLTINSMALDDDGKIVDPFNGKKDLHSRVLRHTTDAFAEDPLRVLRLARFAARFSSWKIHKSTVELCQKIAASGELNELSIERIWTEMEKGFGEESPRRFLEVLVQTKAIEHCNVLHEIFGTLTDFKLEIAKAVGCVPKSQRLYVAIGALAKSTSTLPGAPSRAKDCLANMNALRDSQRCADDLAVVMKRARALQDGPQFTDLCMAVTSTERAGLKMVFSAKRLMTAQSIMRDVKASDFPGLEGRALGAMIDATRIANLQMGLSIPVPSTTQMQG